MEEEEFKIGDLVHILSDSYIFRKDKAYLVREGMHALVIEVIHDECDFPTQYFSEGRRAKWHGSVKIYDEFGRTGWIHAANIILIEKRSSN